MAKTEPVLEYAIAHWNSEFTGVSALSVAEQLNYPHDDVLAAFDELQKEDKGKVKWGVKLFQIRISDKGEHWFGESEEIETAIFFPSDRVLIEHFYNSQLVKELLPEYRIRLHQGASQIGLVYFRISVLQRYLEHPERYIVDDSVAGGTIRYNWEAQANPDHEEREQLAFDMLRYGKRMLVNGEVAVSAIISDLANLPDPEQRYWHSQEISNPSFVELDPDFYRFLLRNFEGKWIDYDDPLQNVLATIQRINETLANNLLFRNVANPYLSYPVLNTYKDFCDRCSELYKVIGPDSINARTIKRLLRDNYGYSDTDFIHRESGRGLSPIQLLKLLALKLQRGSLLTDVIEEVAKHRVSSSHKIIEPEVANKNYHTEFRMLCVSLLDALVSFLEGIQLMEHKLTRDQAFENLEGQTKTLARKVESLLPQIRDILDGNAALPQGSPSEKSAAALIMSQISESLQEVISAVTIAETAIWKNLE